MFKKKTLLSLLAISSLALAACGTTSEDLDNTTPPVEEQEDNGTDETTTDNAAENTPDTTQTPSADLFENITVKPEEVFDIFLDKYPDAKVTQIELDKENGVFRYKVEGFEKNTKYELKIDSTDGAIIKESIDTDEDDHNDEEITREHVEKVTGLVDQVIADTEEDTALKEWQVNVDNGIVKLEVEIDQPGIGDVEYKYNVDTGMLIEKD